MRDRLRGSKRWMILASVLSVAPYRVQAQTWISATDGSWSDPVRWTAPPALNPATVLVFAPTGTQTYTATDDLPGPFTLGGIVFTGTSSGSVTIGAGSLASLRFGGATPGIANSSTAQVTLLGRAALPPVGLTFNLTSPGNNATTLNAVLTGSGGIVVNSTGTGSLQLNSENTFSGGVNLNSGRVELATQTGLGSGTLSVNGGTLGTSLFVAPSGYGPVLPAFANNVNLGANGLRMGGNFGYTLAGNISGTGGINLSPGNLLSGTWTLAGSNTFAGSLTVNGTGSLVTNTLAINSPASLGNAPTINLSGSNARIAFANGASTFTVNAPMTLTNGGAIASVNTTSYGKLVYAGKISGTGGLSILPGGSVTLAGPNDFAGGLNLLGGTTAVNSFQNFGAAGSTVTFSGGSLVLNPGFGISSRKINVAVSGSTLYNFDNVTFTGVISNVSSQGFTKAGAGNLTLTGSSTFSGPLLIAGGNVIAAGPTGVITTGVASITIDAGGGLVLDNTSAAIQRASSTGSIIFGGGNLTVIGNGTQTSSTTVNTQLTFGTTISQAGAGYSVIDIQTTEDTATQVKFSTLNRTGNNGTQALFTGARLGQVAVASPTAGATNFSFTTSPASQLINGIFPWAIADANGGFGSDFATYNATNGVQALTTYSSDFTGGLTANVAISNVTVGAGTTTPSANALKLSAATLTNAGGTLTIGSGAILSTGGPSAITSGTLTIGTSTTNSTSAPTANFFCTSDLTISSNLTNFVPASGLASGIAKGGPGLLLLSGSNSYSGPTRVLAGTLKLGSGTAIPSASDVLMNPGATLDLGGFNATVGSINQPVTSLTTGNNDFGTIAIGAVSLTAGGDDNSTIINSNITGTGTFTKQGVGTLDVVGSQSFTGTVYVAKGAMILDTHAQRGTGFANASKINIGTTTTSADVTLAFSFGVENFTVPLSVQTATGRTATLQFAQSPNGTPGTTIASPITLTNSLIIDSGGGVTLSGLISGAGGITTTSSATTLAAGPSGFALNLTGVNTYTGVTTLTAPVNLFGSASAFGNATTPIALGSSGGLDNPELSSAIGGLTLTRNIVLSDSTNAVAASGTIGSRAALGAATTTYSGTISIAGQRSKLVLYSLGAPVAFTNVISGVPATANVQIGSTAGTGMEYTTSNVTLSGANTYAGGTRLYCGTLNLGNSTTVVGQTITSGPLGTGTFFIGTSGVPGASEPTITAVGAARTIANPIVVSNNFAIGAGSTLVFTGPMDLAGAARILAVNGAVTFGNIVGAAGSALIKDGPGTLNLLGSATYAGPTAVSAGTLAVQTSQILGGALSIGPSSAVVLKAGGATSLTTPAISIDTANGGLLDMNDNDAIIDYAGGSPLASIAALINSGYNNGVWNGLGIDSSVAAAVAANVSNGHKTAIGFGEASTLNITSFAGQSVDGTAVLLRYTLTGDANLDGNVDTMDFTLLAANMGVTGALWQQGDFNFDGQVNGLDFNTISTNFGMSQPAPTLGSLVPEPALIAMFSIGASGLRRRRRGR